MSVGNILQISDEKGISKNKKLGKICNFMAKINSPLYIKHDNSLKKKKRIA